MEMSVTIRDDHVTYVALSGRLDAVGVEEIGDRLGEALEEANRSAIIDLSGIDFLASRGIGLLFSSGKRMKQAGHKLVLLNPAEMVESVLKTCRVDKLMPIAHELDDAVQLAGGAPPKSNGATSTPAAAEGAADQQRAESPDAVAIASDGVLETSIKNELIELEGLNEAVARFLDFHGVPARAAYALNLAIDELVVNVIRYAYVDDETHEIDVQIVIEGEQLVMRICDDGRPFDPRCGPELDLHAEDREAGGLGLFLVLDMVDALKYERKDDHNHVEVRIHLAAEDG